MSSSSNHTVPHNSIYLASCYFRPLRPEYLCSVLVKLSSDRETRTIIRGRRHTHTHIYVERERERERERGVYLPPRSVNRIIQGIHKRMVCFQKLTRNLFLTLHGHKVYRQQQQLSKFLMRYQQFASNAYCGAPGPVSKMALRQEKAFCVLRFEMSRSVITVQREFRARFRKDAPQVRLFRNRNRKPFPAATPSRKLAPRPCSKLEKRTAGSAWETWTVAAADGVRCKVRNKFLVSYWNRTILLCIFCIDSVAIKYEYVVPLKWQGNGE